MYQSTRKRNEFITASQAIIRGIAPDGGLYVPAEIPQITKLDLINLCDMDYKGRAKFILAKYLDDFTPEEISECVDAAYTSEKFPEGVAPIKPVDDKLWSMELWHGPTGAFKDVALQLLPHLMRVAQKKNGKKKKTLILVATSGDTGKAALEGFKDVKDTKIIVFFPEEGVSNIQKMQMKTQEGENVVVYGVYGNFDECQSAVKGCLVSERMLEFVNKKGYAFSSANSINWGRLVPQIVYYFHAYCELVNSGFIKLGDKIDFCVPSGNFGNILACYYAKRMGLPVRKLICASNENHVLTDFFTNACITADDGTFKTTYSPSMDIVIPSNLERLLFEYYKTDDEVIEVARSIKQKVFYNDFNVAMELRDIFSADFADDHETLDEIGSRFKKNGYLCDPHTAVAMNVYRKKGNKDVETVVVSTASPYKFAYPVLMGLGKEPDINVNEFEMLFTLGKETGTTPPDMFVNLRDKELRFRERCATTRLDILIEKTL